MKTITALTLALLLCAGTATAAYAHGWHGRGNHGYHNGWDTRADGYGGRYRDGGPCWSGSGDPGWRNDDGRRFERRDDYRERQQRPDRGAQREQYGNGRDDMRR